MGWERTHNTDELITWERSDGYARIIVRVTARGDWAVSLDRLGQAPEGETYRHETTPDRETAVAIAAEWRDARDIE